MLKRRVQRIHFIGIGGSGMCGIAEILLSLGYSVSGSDLKAGEVTERLKGMGARIALGHSGGNLGDAQVVVYSSAVSRDNPEMVEARRLGIPVIRRAEMLAELMRLKYGVGVAGTHGKTTVTSMAGLVLTEGGLDPTVVIGGRLLSIGGHVRAGVGDYMVAEADESDASFLVLAPVIAVITNIDDDHLDHYRTMDRLYEAFIEFAQKVPFYGAVVACSDDNGVRKILPEMKKRVLTYGFGSDAAVRAGAVEVNPRGSRFPVFIGGREAGEISLAVAGRHNVLNSLAAVGVGLELGVPVETSAKALASFTGVARRLQLKGECNGVAVYDDYGHHPTEIRATIEALSGRARLTGGRLIVLFQPHRFSRTNLLREAFGGAFAAADYAVITEIYSAGEDPIPGVTGQSVLDEVRKFGKPQCEFARDLESGCAAAVKNAAKGDFILTLGAGDVGRCGERVLALLAGGGS
jgi:UDP-N-acetylmuramate--alanine ligase